MKRATEKMLSLLVYASILVVFVWITKQLP